MRHPTYTLLLILIPFSLYPAASRFSSRLLPLWRSSARNAPVQSPRTMGSWRGDGLQFSADAAKIQTPTATKRPAFVYAQQPAVQQQLEDGKKWHLQKPQVRSAQQEHAQPNDYAEQVALQLLQTKNGYDQDVNSRVDEASIITSLHEYNPEPYEDLNKLQKKLESPEAYAAFEKELSELKNEGVQVKRFTYEVDGQDVVGFALHPKETAEQKEHPLVISFRGGFNGEGVFHEWAKIDLPWIMRHYADLARNGYLVLVSQYRNAEGNTNKDEFGGQDVNDVMALFDVAQQLGLNTEQIYLNAFSRGTVMLKQMLERLKTERPELYDNIQAAVIKGGISDLETFLQQDPKYMEPILQQARDDFDQNREQILKDLSLVRKPELLESIPTLILHNERDNVVPADLSRNLAQALDDVGAEYKVHFYSGKHHQILEHNDDVKERVVDWFDKH